MIIFVFIWRSMKGIRSISLYNNCILIFRHLWTNFKICYCLYCRLWLRGSKCFLMTVLRKLLEEYSNQEYFIRLPSRLHSELFHCSQIVVSLTHYFLCKENEGTVWKFILFLNGKKAIFLEIYILIKFIISMFYINKQIRIHM